MFIYINQYNNHATLFLIRVMQVLFDVNVDVMCLIKGVVIIYSRG